MFNNFLNKKDDANWYFPSAKGLQLESVNNAAIETFKGNPLASLAREICQNSIDAVDDTTKPVKVSFNFMNLKQDDFPNINEFKEIFYSARKTWQGKNEQVIDFINEAESVLSEDTIPFLKISDYNTKGLQGADSRKLGTPWSTLIKEKGSSNKSDTSGGSFGIGKAAPFACSSLRTLFYSTCINETKDKYHISVSNLMSFEKENDEVTQGVGFYSHDELTDAINGDVSFTDETRRQHGTDIYIAGFNKAENWKTAIKHSILSNFFVTIWKKKLIVDIEGEEINADNLHVYIQNLSEDYADIKDYLEVLTSEDAVKIEIESKDYGEKYHYQDGEAVLYLLKKYPANRRILMTREKGMSLFEQKGISSSIYFTGILMIEGRKMNTDFKQMENPSHNEWSPERYKDPKLAQKMLKELRKYNKDKVIELFQEKVTEEMDAVGMSDFLPDDTLDSNVGDINKKEEVVPRINEVKVKKKQQTKEPLAANIPGKVEDDTFDEQLKFAGIDEGTGSEGNPNGEPNDSDGGTGGNTTGDSVGPNEPTENEGGIEMTVPVPKQKLICHPTYKIVCNDAQSGHYTLMLKSNQTINNPIIETFIIGEQSSYKVNVLKAAFNDTSLLTTRNRFQLNKILKNRMYQIDINVNFNQLARIGVKVYESEA